LGAKPGTAITDAPRRQNIAKAERDFTIELLTLSFDPSAVGDRDGNNRDEK
jgi:hypothetical protein